MSARPVTANTHSTHSVFCIDLDKGDGKVYSWADVRSLRRVFIDLSSAEEFKRHVAEGRLAINEGIYPERTSTGSSGSYFVQNKAGQILGIFKPRDEEPYADLNPRWTKWLHRYCSPCVFGRACLMPNSGYVSEAGASAVDRFFGLQLVPHTQVITLSSPTFSYREHEKHTTPLPTRIGSFQVFVEEFSPFTAMLPYLKFLLGKSHPFAHQLKCELEKLICLDYIIRNTDRTVDNWLIRVLWIHQDDDTHEVVSTQLVPTGNFSQLMPIVKIAAIDNGLAFPWKHPVGLRRYPYSWEDLPQVLTPFSQDIREKMLTKLDDPECWEELCIQLGGIISSSENSATPYINRQLSVLRGQLWNLRKCLHQHQSTPADLLSMPAMRVEEDGLFFWKKYGHRSDKGGFKEDCIANVKLWVREEPRSSSLFCCGII